MKFERFNPGVESEAKMEDWTNVKVFVEVVRRGNLGAAADAVGLSVPTVRRRIETMESDIGIPLFERTPRGLTPTPTALRLVGLAESMERAMNLPAADAKEERPSVRVIGGQVIGGHMLKSTFRALRGRYPELRLDVTTTRLWEDASQRPADLTIAVAAPWRQVNFDIRVGAMEVGLFAHRDYLKSAGTPHCVDDLKGHTLLGPESATAVTQNMEMLGLTLRPEDFSLRTDSNMLDLQALTSGLGIGITYAGLARDFPDLRRVQPEVGANIKVGLIASPGALNLPDVRIVSDQIIDGLSA